MNVNLMYDQLSRPQAISIHWLGFALALIFAIAFVIVYTYFLMYWDMYAYVLKELLVS